MTVVVGVIVIIKTITVVKACKSVSWDFWSGCGSSSKELVQIRSCRSSGKRIIINVVRGEWISKGVVVWLIINVVVAVAVVA